MDAPKNLGHHDAGSSVEVKEGHRDRHRRDEEVRFSRQSAGWALFFFNVFFRFLQSIFCDDLFPGFGSRLLFHRSLPLNVDFLWMHGCRGVKNPGQKKGYEGNILHTELNSISRVAQGVQLDGSLADSETLILSHAPLNGEDRP